MKYQKLADQIWQDLAFVAKEYLKMFSHLVNSWRGNKKKVIVTVLFLIFVFFLSAQLANWLWGSKVGSGSEFRLSKASNVSETIQISQGTGSDNQVVNSTVQANLVVVEAIVKIFSPLLDGFVATTPDVVGKTESQINFSYGSMKPSSFYSDQLMQVAFPFLVILLSWQAVSLLFYAQNERSKEDLASLLSRLVTVVLMFIITPYILSYSILVMNALNQFILGEDKISGYLYSFFVEIKEIYSVETGWKGLFKGVLDFGSGLNPGSSLINSFQLVLVLVPIYLSILIFLFVIFQFVIRFLKLYFLSLAYPLIVIFYLNKNSQIPVSFWKEWTTSLVHQTGFVMGYKIINDLVLDILKSGGVGLEQMLIYIAGLLFLLSINVLTAQLWGNAFSAISDNVASKGLGSLIGSPFSLAGKTVTGFGAGAIGVPTRNSLSGFAGSKIREGIIGRHGGVGGFLPKKRTDSSASFSPFTASNSASFGYSFSKFDSQKNPPQTSGYAKVAGTRSNVELKDPTKSKSAQRMSQKGYEITGVSQKEGVIGVKGLWQAYDNPVSGITTLYETKDEAVADGIKNPDKLYEVDGSYNLLDTVNYQGVQNYAKRTNSKPLADNTPNKQANQTLNSLREDNFKNDIQGITTSQYSREMMEKYAGKPPKETPRIQKGFVYTEAVSGMKKSR